MSRWGTGIGVAARVQALVAAVGVPCGAEAAVGRTRLCSGPVVSFMLRPCLPESRCPSLGTIWLAGALLGKRRQGRMPKTPPLRCALGVRLVELTASRARYHPGQPSGTAEGDGFKRRGPVNAGCGELRATVFGWTARQEHHRRGDERRPPARPTSRIPGVWPLDPPIVATSPRAATQHGKASTTSATTAVSTACHVRRRTAGGVALRVPLLQSRPVAAVRQRAASDRSRRGGKMNPRASPRPCDPNLEASCP